MRRWKRWVDRELTKVQSDGTSAAWDFTKLARLPIGRGAPPRKQLDRTFAAVVDILRRHPNAEARKGAAYVLAFWGERRTVRPLLAALENENEDAHVRAMAAEGIGYALQYERHPLKGRAVAALRSALASSSPDIRFFSVFALGTIKAKEARGDLEALVDDATVVSPGWWTVGEEARDALVVLDGGGWPERAVVPASAQGEAERVAGLIVRALDCARSGDDDAYMEVASELYRYDGELVTRMVSAMAVAADPVERALVPDVLRWVGEGDTSRRERTVEVLVAMLSTEKDTRVLTAIGLAFVDLSHPAAVEWMPQYVGHPDSKVRAAVVHALLAHRDPRAIATLITLSSDPDANVRNWATFGLGSQLGSPEEADVIDTAELREALAARLSDDHEETRAEAMVGLALRGDIRALPAVISELSRGPRYYQVVEAASYLAMTELCVPLRRFADGLTPEERESWETSGHRSLSKALRLCCGPSPTG